MKIHSNPRSNRSRTGFALRTALVLRTCCALTVVVTLAHQAECQSVPVGTALSEGISLTDRTVAKSAAVPSQAGPQSGIFQFSGEPYRVISATDYADGGGTISQTTSNAIAQAGCMVDGGTGNACNSCGRTYGFGSSCPTCESYWYVSAEFLSMRRNSKQRVVVAPGLTISEYDMEHAPRLTIGMVPDCVKGYELTLTGRFSWERSGTLTDPSGGIGTLLFTVPPVDPSALSAFENSVEKTHTHTSEYWSIEFSNTVVDHDIAKLLCGPRFIDFDENYTISSTNLSGQSGLLRSDVDNRMLGYQLGMELYYPILRRTYIDFRARGGAYANFIDLDLQIVNDGALVGEVFDDSIKLAFQGEIGGGVRVDLLDRLSFRIGGELWYFSRISAARDQFNNGIVGRRNVHANSDFFIGGVSAGFEYFY